MDNIMSRNIQCTKAKQNYQISMKKFYEYMNVYIIKNDVLNDVTISLTYKNTDKSLTRITISQNTEQNTSKVTIRHEINTLATYGCECICILPSEKDSNSVEKLNNLIQVDGDCLSYQKATEITKQFNIVDILPMTNFEEMVKYIKGRLS